MNLNRFVPAAALVLAALAPAPAWAVSASNGPAEVSIPFVDRGNIRKLRVGDDDTLFVQDRARRWYKIELSHEALDLRYSSSFAVDTGPIDRLDRFSAVIIDGVRIPVRSVVRVEESHVRSATRADA